MGCQRSFGRQFGGKKLMAELYHLRLVCTNDFYQISIENSRPSIEYATCSIIKWCFYMSQDINVQNVHIHDPKEDENKKWLFEEKANMMKYCRNKELGADRLLDQHYAGLAPYFALWAVENRKEHKKYWVITGDLPHDHIPFEVADSPRNALKYFSMAWQLKAEKIQEKLDSKELVLGTPEQQKDMIALLQDRAVNLYEISTNDQLWQ